MRLSLKEVISNEVWKSEPGKALRRSRGVNID
jgi:hypothetical protein